MLFMCKIICAFLFFQLRNWCKASSSKLSNAAVDSFFFTNSVKSKSISMWNMRKKNTVLTAAKLKNRTFINVNAYTSTDLCNTVLYFT